MLTQEGCRKRQARLREKMSESEVDAVVFSDHLEIYYFTGIHLSLFPNFSFPVFYYLDAKGSWLACHTEEGEALVDDRITYEWHTLYTLNPNLMRLLDRTMKTKLKDQKRAGRIGWQEEGIPKLLADSVAETLDPVEWIPIDDLLEALHKKKDPDEVELLRGGIRADLAAYSAAQKVIRPGVNELDVLAAGQQAAYHAVGEMIFHGGDYRSGELGGTARNREIEEGEMYIIDAQSNYRGYWADLCRTFAVGEPTDDQASVYEHIAGILKDIPDMVKPGGSATELWKAIDVRTQEHPILRNDGLIHHGGHGVGLHPHETPDLNRDRDAIFEVGDVFSCEPGGYREDLRYGVRLEDTYLITEDGVENLVDYPFNLVPEK